MSAPHDITDRAALERHRRRASKSTDTDLFLHRAALKEIRMRLADINRTFGAQAVVSGCPEFWREAFPDAEIVADTELIVFTGKGFDLVIHAMALHWSNDPVGQFIQCRRVMAPDGLLLAVCFGGDTLAEMRTAMIDADIRTSGGASPRVAPMASVRDCGFLLQRAGFALPVADRVVISVSYPTSLTLMHDLRAMGETNALAARRRIPSRRSFFDAAELIYRSAFADSGGRLKATFDLMFMTGWVPSVGQQQPLRPGSAQARLADALKTVEHNIGR